MLYCNAISESPSSSIVLRCARSLSIFIFLLFFPRLVWWNIIKAKKLRMRILFVTKHKSEINRKILAYSLRFHFQQIYIYINLIFFIRFSSIFPFYFPRHFVCLSARRRLRKVKSSSEDERKWNRSAQHSSRLAQILPKANEIYVYTCVFIYPLSDSIAFLQKGQHSTHLNSFSVCQCHRRKIKSSHKDIPKRSCTDWNEWETTLSLSRFRSRTSTPSRASEFQIRNQKVWEEQVRIHECKVKIVSLIKWFRWLSTCDFVWSEKRKISEAQRRRRKSEESEMRAKGEVESLSRIEAMEILRTESKSSSGFHVNRSSDITYRVRWVYLIKCDLTSKERKTRRDKRGDREEESKSHIWLFFAARFARMQTLCNKTIDNPRLGA